MTYDKNTVKFTTMILKQLKNQKLINCNDFVVDNAIFVALTGSVAYGASNNMSDIDIYGITVPPLEYIYPSKYGEIDGFSVGRLPRFDEYQQHHIQFNNAEYDVKIYSIVKFFQLAMHGNPNVIDSLFTPANCVLHIDVVMQRIFMQRNIFLSKQCYERFRGFAYNHLKSMKQIKAGREHYCKYGYDVKDASHIVRQLLGIIEILETGDYILNKNAEEIIRIRQGYYSYEEMLQYCENLLCLAQIAKEKSSLRDEPDYQAIKKLLVNTIDSFHLNGDFE